MLKFKRQTRNLLMVPGGLLCTASACLGQASLNLISDASFESPVAPLWQALPARSVHVEKEHVVGAAAGKTALIIQGWDKVGSKVLSSAFTSTGDTYTATAQVRAINATEGASVEMALFDEAGAEKLASFAILPLTGQAGWKQIGGTAKLPATGVRVRLGFIVSGPQRGARLEADSVGVFAGPTVGAVSNNVDWAWFEAEELADGTVWTVQDHYPGWYSGFPHGKMLAGPDGIAEADNKPVAKTMTVGVPGLHRLWVRFVRPTVDGKFTIALQQNGKVLSSKEILETDPQYGTALTWVWASIEADLTAGPVEVVLTRPHTGASWITRKIDLFLLTNLPDYTPSVQDIESRGFMRFINKSTGVEPFLWWGFVRRHQPPDWYVTPGILSAAGFDGSYYAPADREKWLWPGEASPWVDITQYLLPATGRNNVQFVATRKMHTDGLVREPIKGTFEFAVGVERRVLKTVEIDQTAPRVLFALPDNFTTSADKIRSPFDFIRESNAVLDKIGKPQGRVARHLDLNAILSLDAEQDDPKVIAAEINILKRLGFNNLYTPITKGEDAEELNAKHGLAQRFGTVPGLWYHIQENCHNLPDLEKMDAVMKAHAAQYAPIADKIISTKMADEPGGMSYDHIVAHNVCRQMFAAGLQEQGLTPKDLGVATREEVVPVAPADSEKHPELFYHTAMFRLQSFANLARVTTAIKNKYFPTTAKSFVNYVPPHSEYVDWPTVGSDPFMAQRHGGLEMGWNEDWLGYGASSQQISDSLAMMRAAGTPPGAQQPQPQGGYMVAVSGGPLVQRLKYYGMVAGGLRQINVYSYGPHYSGIDDWSAIHSTYPTISAVQHELGNIDEALHGTSRRKSDVAILYNRTASIWARGKGTSQQDVRLMRWALSHAGYDADFLAEEDVEADQLRSYKVLYLSGPQVRRATATKITDWVQAGGVLFGNAGAGSRDEYDRPLTTLQPVFGVTSENLKLENDSGRPRFEFRTLPILDVLKTDPAGGAPVVTFDQLSYRETLIPAATAKVILRNKAGAPVGVLNTFGQGRAVRVAAMPGTSYLSDAVREKEYDIESYLPKKYRTELRDFIAWPAMLAKAARVAHASTPITEIVRYDGPGRAVVFIIDHNAEPNPNFTVKVPQAGQFKKAFSASGQPVTIKQLGGGMIQLALPLDVSDAIVLE